MATKKTIAVVGATGAQGGGLVRAILNDPNGDFVARALTRNANSEKAQELAGMGGCLDQQARPEGQRHRHRIHAAG